jgi:trans-aconitate 2-methyltransferase
LDWDAATYDRVSAPQQAWADEQLSRLALRPGEAVLDAGCGTGRITARLADLVGPDGRVYGVDAAPSMAALARSRMTLAPPDSASPDAERAAGRLGDRATILCQDLVQLSLPEPVDAVFSNATFHWIPDHDALFAAIHRALKPGGRLVAQCGGEGNIAAFKRAIDATMSQAPFAAHFAGWPDPWNYQGPDATRRRLERTGFTEVRCWLEPKPTVTEDPREFARASVVVRHLDVLPPRLHAPFLDGVMARFAAPGEPVVFDYVRLNMTAHRPGTPEGGTTGPFDEVESP